MKTKLIRLFVALASLALPALIQAQFTFTTNNGAITITGYTGGGTNFKFVPFCILAPWWLNQFFPELLDFRKRRAIVTPLEVGSAAR